MSEKFNGFSQDEINKMSTRRTKIAPTELAKKEAFRLQHVGIRRMPDKWTKPNSDDLKKQHLSRPQSAPTIKNNAAITKTQQRTAVANDAEALSQDTIDEINLDRSMSKSLEEALFYQPLRSATHTKRDVINGNISTTANGDSSLNNESSILKLPPIAAATNFNEVSSSTCGDDTINDSSILPTHRLRTSNAVTPTELNLDSPFKGISLKDFETHRKMIEEQNKQKKEILYKAIEHHSQKTAAEARKIEEIKSELAKLDNDLAVDVAILRKQIDNACINFTNIEKQYMKIEAQFLKAKIDLHNASEKKELLTEHLCTVIAHNEDRKAQKLSELMQKVGLTPAGEPDVCSTSGINSIN